MQAHANVWHRNCSAGIRTCRSLRYPSAPAEIYRPHSIRCCPKDTEVCHHQAEFEILGSESPSSPHPWSQPRRSLLLGGALALLNAQGTLSARAEEGELLPEEATQPASQKDAPAASPALEAPTQPSGNGNGATAAEQTIGPADYKYPFSSQVPSNLRIKEYVSIIKQSRPGCWQRIAQRIQASEYSALSDDLNMGPFADLRQASLYIPWAMMQRDDYNKAIDCRKGYNDFDSHVQDLQAAAAATASGNGDPQRVQQAFFLMSASLDSYLALIPTGFLGAPKD